MGRQREKRVGGKKSAEKGDNLGIVEMPQGTPLTSFSERERALPRLRLYIKDAGD